MRRRFLNIALSCVIISVLAGLATLLVLNRVRSPDQGTALPSGVPTQSAREVQSLEQDTIIQGYPCARGWVHFYPNGALHRFVSTQPLRQGRDTIPPGTWVTLDPDGALVRCSFPADTVIQGHLCRGTGGAKGVTTSFHPDGALEAFFPPADTTIQGVNCAGGILDQSVVLYEDGKLRKAVLAEDAVLDGRNCPKGDRVTWDPTGRVVSVAAPTWTKRGLRKVFDWLQ